MQTAMCESGILRTRRCEWAARTESEAGQRGVSGYFSKKADYQQLLWGFYQVPWGVGRAGDITTALPVGWSLRVPLLFPCPPSPSSSFLPAFLTFSCLSILFFPFSILLHIVLLYQDMA